MVTTHDSGRPERRNLRSRFGKGAAVFLTLGVLASQGAGVQPAQAYETPFDTPLPSDRAGFLPAPNPAPYCESVDYFGYFDVNTLAWETNTNREVTTAKALTNDDGSGPSMIFTTTQRSTTGNFAPSTPMAGVGNSASRLASIGVVMNGASNSTEIPAKGFVSLSEPLFYSQWVFTDMDQQSEGFNLTPAWSSQAYKQYGMYSPKQTTTTASWVYTGSTPDFVHFNAERATSVQGSDLAGRSQVDFYGPITGLGMERSGSGGSGFAAGAGCPAIGISKTASDPVWNPATQQFDVNYTLNVVNNLPSQASLDAAIAAATANPALSKSEQFGGGPQAIDEINLQIDDALQRTGFLDPIVSNLSSPTLNVNTNYNGISDTKLLSGTDTLVAEGTATVTFTVSYPPDSTSSAWDDCANELSNQALVTATAAGVAVKDLSDDGPNPEPTNNNGYGGVDDPTNVAFSFDCGVGLAKKVAAGPTSNGDGSYNVTYEFLAKNYGTVDVSAISIADDLTKAYGSDLVSATTTADTCATLPNGVLKGGATCTKKIEVVFKPTQGICPFVNSATLNTVLGGTGTGLALTDVSQDGADPDPDGDGDPSNNSDPTRVCLTAAISLDKTVSAGPTNNGDGTYNTSYKLLVTNTGFAYTDNIVVNDDLARIFGDSLISSKKTDKCVGVGLDAGQTCEVLVDVVFKAGSRVSWQNDATVTGNAGGESVTDKSSATVSIVENPAIEIVKSLISKTNNGDGTYTVLFKLVVTNTGDVPLGNIAVTDDLTKTFGDKLISGGVVTNTCNGVTLLAAPAAGAPGTCELTVQALVRPGSELGPYTNVADVTGTTPTGDKVVDPSNPVQVSFEQKPVIGLAKYVSGGPRSNSDGTYDVDYTLIAKNMGDVTLTNIVVTDDLPTIFGDKFIAQKSRVDNCATATLRPSNPAGNGDSCTVILTVHVRPGTNLGPYNNTANVTGTSPDGSKTTDQSQNGKDVDPDGDGDPTNNSDPTPVSFGENPLIGLAKRVAKGPTDNGDGTFTVVFELISQNMGDVPLSDIKVTDDLTATFGDKLVSSSIDDKCVGVTLAPSVPPGSGATCITTITALVRPGFNLGPYNNTAFVTGVSPGGTTVTDQSTDGVNVDPDGDGDPTNNSDPTPVTFAEHPQIGLTKRLVRNPVENGDGSFTVEFQMVANNSGDVPLSNVSMVDNMVTTFGADRRVEVVSLTVGPPGTANPGYNGSTNIEMLTNTNLQVGESVTANVVVRVWPGQTQTFYNTAVTTGTSPQGRVVRDASQDQGLPDSKVGPDPDGDGDPTNNNDLTPVTLTPTPAVVLPATGSNALVLGGWATMFLGTGALIVLISRRRRHAMA